MRSISLLLSTFLLASTASACPDIEGDWLCYEKNYDYTYKENFKITKNGSVWTYLQTLTDDAGEQPTFDKISDNVERLVNHVAIGENDYYFRQNSFCPAAHILQTHEVVERHVNQKLVGKSSAEFILQLEPDNSLSMITHSVSEEGISYENEFVGKCKRTN